MISVHLGMIGLSDLNGDMKTVLKKLITTYRLHKTEYDNVVLVPDFESGDVEIVGKIYPVPDVTKYMEFEEVL